MTDSTNPQHLIGSAPGELPDYFREAMALLSEDPTADAGLGVEDELVDLEGEMTEGTEESEDITGEDLVLDVALVAASLGKEFDGAALAQALRAGPELDDVRFHIALAVIGTNQKVTADRVLSVMSELGFASEVEAAKVGKVALEASDVPVISTTPVPMGSSDGEGAGAGVVTEADVSLAMDDSESAGDDEESQP